jgi:hypothetical protein
LLDTQTNENDHCKYSRAFEGEETPNALRAPREILDKSINIRSWEIAKEVLETV